MPSDESKHVAASVSGERLEYIKWRNEQTDESNSAILREGIDCLIKQDEDWGDNPGSNTESNDEEEMLVPVHSSDTEVNLADPDSDFYTGDEVWPVDPKNLSDIDSIPALAGQFHDNKTDDRRGLKHVYKAALEWRAQENNGRLTRLDIREVLEDELGRPRRTSDRAVRQLVQDGYLLPHPASEHGVLSDTFRAKMRLKLAGKADKYSDPESALTKKEKKKYPDDWSDLLVHYEEFSREVYYTSRAKYLSSLVDAMGTSLLSAVQTDQTWTPKFSDTQMDGQKNVQAWRIVGKKFSRILRSEVDGFDTVEDDRFTFPYGGDYDRGFRHLMAQAHNLSGNDEGSDEFADWQANYNVLINGTKELVDEQTGDDISSEYGMSLNEAADLFGWDNPRECTEDEVTSRFRKLVKSEHPDMDEGRIANGTTNDLATARSVLKEVALDQDPEHSNDEDDDSNDFEVDSKIFDAEPGETEDMKGTTEMDSDTSRNYGI